MITIQEIRQRHREYIFTELAKRGLGHNGILVRYGMRDEKHITKPDNKFKNIYGSFLECNNQLTGEKGRKIREAFEMEGIDLSKSPTYPLEPIENKKAS